MFYGKLVKGMSCVNKNLCQYFFVDGIPLNQANKKYAGSLDEHFCQAPA
jgi:hypothetical protein